MLRERRGGNSQPLCRWGADGRVPAGVWGLQGSHQPGPGQRDLGRASCWESVICTSWVAKPCDIACSSLGSSGCLKSAVEHNYTTLCVIYTWFCVCYLSCPSMKGWSWKVTSLRASRKTTWKAIRRSGTGPRHPRRLPAKVSFWSGLQLLPCSIKIQMAWATFPRSQHHVHSFSTCLFDGI